MTNRNVVSSKEWVAARKELLAKEKGFSCLRDAQRVSFESVSWIESGGPQPNSMAD